MNSISTLPKEKQEAWLASLTDEQLAHLQYDWEFRGRPEQFAPPGDWVTWLVLTGRGWGKTRTGSEFIRSMMCGTTPLEGGKYQRLALVGETAADSRDVMVEGESGILSVHPPAFRPLYESSKRRLTWPNGAVASLFNATEPDQLRGPQHDLAWCDELAKWRYANETWDMLQFGLRLGEHPRQIITTTPRPIPLIRELLRKSIGENPEVVVTRGKTMENRANLAPSFFDTVVKKYEGTRLGRQELNAEVLDDVVGSLWTRANLDEKRVTEAQCFIFKRVVVGIDPAAKEESETTAETGIIACALGEDGRGYVLSDVSGRLSPNGWARMALSAIDMHDGDAIVAEINNGGDMVANTIRSARSAQRVIEVRASRGKVTRAEPIAALYEQGRISHVGTFAALEDQMVLFTPFGIVGDTTADRVDALVWAFSELFPGLTRKVPKSGKMIVEGIGNYDPQKF